MDREVAEFRSWYEAQKRRTPTGRTRLPAARRAWASQHVATRIAAGARVAEVVHELGATTRAVRSWLKLGKDAARAPRGSFVRVKVRGTPAAAGAALALVAPGGYRVEGLDVTSCAALLRSLT